MDKIKVEFFTATDGSSPVQSFLDKLTIKQQVKVLRKLKYLQEFGSNSSIPNNKKLQDTQLWELRIVGKDNLRIFYSPTGETKITLLHGFIKKKQKTPLKEINIALSRLKGIKVDK